MAINIMIDNAFLLHLILKYDGQVIAFKILSFVCSLSDQSLFFVTVEIKQVFAKPISRDLLQQSKKCNLFKQIDIFLLLAWKKSNSANQWWLLLLSKCFMIEYTLLLFVSSLSLSLYLYLSIYLSISHVFIRYF